MKSRVLNKIDQIYGYSPNIMLSIRRNVFNILLKTPLVMLQSKPTNLAFHDLCDATTLPKTVKSLLGLGLNFSIRPINQSIPNYQRFTKDYDRRVLFSGDNTEEEDEVPVLYYPNEDWIPPVPTDELLRRRVNFEFKVRYLFANNKINTQNENLLKSQEAALQWLKANPNLTICNADKNLGPVIMEREKYVRYAYEDHLSDKNTYRQLSQLEAVKRLSEIEEKIHLFLEIFHVSTLPTEKTYIKRTTLANSLNPSYMYLLCKIHKQPTATRAIISYSGSVCHGIAKWLDVELKKILKHLPYIASSSATVVKDLKNLNKLPPNSLLFTMDAVSMYTNIHLGHALPIITEFLSTTTLGKKIQRDEGISVSKLAYALELIMENNVFQFGNTYWLQLAGTAMGTPPAPNYATIYFALYERLIVPKFKELTYYRRYIDDGFGIWSPDPTLTAAEDLQRWNCFKNTIGNFGEGHEFFNEHPQLHPLRWKFLTTATDTLDKSRNKIFLDLDVQINSKNEITTKIYEKELNLYLYLPPHSCHPPGMIKGLIFGFVHRAHALCTTHSDKLPFLQKCYYRLLARGYKREVIRPIFNEAIYTVFNKPKIITKRLVTKKPLFLHLTYNPVNPTTYQLQQCFKTAIVSPPNANHISEEPTDNPFNSNPDFDRCVICYSGQRTIGNILAPRKHRFGPNFQVSTYLQELQNG